MKKVLYLGTDPEQFERDEQSLKELIHYPVIKIIPRSVENPDIRCAYEDLDLYTHLVFTSKNAVQVFCQHMNLLDKHLSDLNTKIIAAIGEATAAKLGSQGLIPSWTSKVETQEGMVEMLSKIDLKNAYVFLPRSALSRPILLNFFKEQKIRFQACDLYDTVTQALDPKPDLTQVDEIVFTSPSTVKAFLEIFGRFPSGKKLSAIGPITQEALDFFRNSLCVKN
jgi:uroporphyrinogen-III synthase